jgi:hypothetical protein
VKGGRGCGEVVALAMAYNDMANGRAGERARGGGGGAPAPNPNAEVGRGFGLLGSNGTGED